MSYRVYDSSHDYNLFLLRDLVNHPVREALWVSPANVLMWMTPAVKQRIHAELIEHRQEFFDKSVTKTFAAAVIPRGNLDNVILYFRS